MYTLIQVVESLNERFKGLVDESVRDHSYDPTLNFSSTHTPNHADYILHDGPGDTIVIFCLKGSGLLVFNPYNDNENFRYVLFLFVLFIAFSVRSTSKPGLCTYSIKNCASGT